MKTNFILLCICWLDQPKIGRNLSQSWHVLAFPNHEAQKQEATFKEGQKQSNKDLESKARYCEAKGGHIYSLV